jgi:hypothetical protein
MALLIAISGPKKVLISEHNPSMALVRDIARIEIIMSGAI